LLTIGKVCPAQNSPVTGVVGRRSDQWVVREIRFVID
jgi:hypothetical protein